MEYKVLYTKKAIRQLSKINAGQKGMILAWIEKNLVGTVAPRKYGCPLNGNLKKYWRYRVGNYRVIAEINDNKIKIMEFDSAFLVHLEANHG